MSRLSERAKKVGVQVFDLDKDGALTKNDAEIARLKATATARTWEERYPLGLLIAAFAAGCVLTAVVLW